MYKKSNPVTHLCHSDVDYFWIRGRNLCADLIGKLSFTDMIVLHFLGTQPTALQRVAVDAVLVCIMEHGMTPSAVASRVTYLGAPESLQGAGGKAFCTGGEQSDHAGGQYGDNDARGAVGMPVEELHSVIRDVPKPVIAKVARLRHRWRQRLRRVI